MNSSQQEDHLKYITDKMAEIMLKKGDDYAGEDRLFNFKAVGMMCGLTPAKVCQVLIAVKVTRLTTLLKKMETGGTPNFESISDTMVDLANYSALMDMCLKDETGM